MLYRNMMHRAGVLGAHGFGCAYVLCGFLAIIFYLFNPMPMRGDFKVTRCVGDPVRLRATRAVSVFALFL